jgi:Raf kinase inhibitor-like YbhB/YbcL family protein
MKRRLICPARVRVLQVSALIALAVLTGCRSEAPPPQQGGAAAGPPRTGSTAEEPGAIELTSPAFAQGRPIPKKYTADGDDVSPPLAWSGLPEGTKELALICDDPDAPDPDNPRPDPWVHWVVYSIPATAKGLPETIPREPRPQKPAGIVQGRNSWPAAENVGYGGPSPPKGRHRYFFRLYALDSELDAPPGLDKTRLLRAMEGHILAEGRLMGTYAR